MDFGYSRTRTAGAVGFMASMSPNETAYLESSRPTRAGRRWTPLR
jgi:hypothetical protein